MHFKLGMHYSYYLAANLFKGKKHSFGNIYLQFKENLTHWLTEYSNTNLFSCLVLEFHELHCVLFLLRFIPQLGKMHFRLNLALNPYVKGEKLIWMFWIPSKNTFLSTFFEETICLSLVDNYF